LHRREDDASRNPVARASARLAGALAAPGVAALAVPSSRAPPAAPDEPAAAAPTHARHAAGAHIGACQAGAGALHCRGSALDRSVHPGMALGLYLLGAHGPYSPPPDVVGGASRHT